MNEWLWEFTCKVILNWELRESLTDLHKYYYFSQKLTENWQWSAMHNEQFQMHASGLIVRDFWGPWVARGFTQSGEWGENKQTKIVQIIQYSLSHHIWRCPLLYLIQGRQKLGHSITGTDGHTLSVQGLHALSFRELLGNGMLSAQVTAGAHWNWQRERKGKGKGGREWAHQFRNFWPLNRDAKEERERNWRKMGKIQLYKEKCLYR